MTLREINDMDVIAYSRAIARRIIVTPNIELLPTASRNLCNDWHQIIWNTFGVLSDQTAFMRTNRVEIPQNCYFPARITGKKIAEHVLNYKFCPTIWVGSG